MPVLMLRETLISFDNRATEYRVPKHIKNIADRCFNERWELQELTLPEDLDSIGSYAFRKCIHLRRIRMPKKVEHLGTGLFQECTALRQVRIPQGAEEIDFEMFQRCESLREIHLPETVQRVHGSAFATCSSLEYLFVPASVFSILPPSMQSIAALSFMGKEGDENSGIRKNEDVTAFDRYGVEHGHELMEAGIRRGDVSAVRYLLEKNFISENQIPGYLSQANDQKQTEVAAVLLQRQKVNPDRDIFDWDPFDGM